LDLPGARSARIRLRRYGWIDRPSAGNPQIDPIAHFDHHAADKLAGLYCQQVSAGQTAGRGLKRAGAAKVFIVSQVALSFLLVAGALLLVRSFWNLTHQDFGFQPENLVVAELTGDGRNHRALDTEIRQQLYQRINQMRSRICSRLGFRNSGIVVGHWRGANRAAGPHFAGKCGLSDHSGVAPIYGDAGHFHSSRPVHYGGGSSHDDESCGHQ
jgi:hypothetical protein